MKLSALFLEADSRSDSQQNCPALTETEFSLPCSWKPITGHYVQPD